jgi:hypothetical protein
MKNETLKILKINYKWLIAGIFLVILGYLILSINTGNKPYEQTVFAWHKLTLAPIILIGGYFSIGFSILTSKEK